MNLHQMHQATEKEIFEAFRVRAGLEKREVIDSEKKLAFMFIEGDPASRICLVAHVDTVAIGKPSKLNLVENYGILRAENKHGAPTILGADDRAGCWCLWELMDHPKKPHILLTNHEERGGLGASEFSESKLTEMFGIQWFIEFDRKGINKYVQYNDNPAAMHSYLHKFGIENDGRGTFSDISIISRKTLVPSVNMATGYFNQHTINEYLDIAGMYLAIQKTRLMISEFPDEGFGMIEEESKVYFPWYKQSRCESTKEDALRKVVSDADDYYSKQKKLTHLRPAEWCPKCSEWEDSCTCECFYCGFPKWQCKCQFKSNRVYSGI